MIRLIRLLIVVRPILLKNVLFGRLLISPVIALLPVFFQSVVALASFIPSSCFQTRWRWFRILSLLMKPKFRGKYFSVRRGSPRQGRRIIRGSGVVRPSLLLIIIPLVVVIFPLGINIFIRLKPG